jgi:site-specific DNA recombinase
MQSRNVPHELDAAISDGTPGAIPTKAGPAKPRRRIDAASARMLDLDQGVARLLGGSARSGGLGRARDAQFGDPDDVMKRCAIYARFSTEMQRAASLEDQVRNCRRFAAQLGWEVVEGHIYQDSALSGFGVEHRPAYQRLVATALAANPPFAVILVDDLSRLSRDLVETLKLYRRLKRHGIELVAVADGIQTSHQMAKLQITIKGLVNELYLDDLRDKTHRGLTGQALKGMSAGGRLFGYRTSRADGGAAWVVFEPEAEIVRRIFRMYADGLSMKTIAVRLNDAGETFPAKATRRGAERRGWAVSTIHTILKNEKYLGRWVWNKTTFVKDPETGKRTPMSRPKDDWVIDDRPDLAIVDPELWTRVEERLQAVRAAYGGTERNKRPRGQAPELYSRHLLSGLLRCAICGARVTIQTSTRKKANGVVYRYGRYRCSFHVAKGTSVCGNNMSIRQDVLEARLLERFRGSLTPDMIDYLVRTTNEILQGAQAHAPDQVQALLDERQRVETELSNLVEFVVKGTVSSPRLRDEIRAREDRLAELDRQLGQLQAAATPAPIEIDRSWIERRLEALKELLAQDPAGARREIQKHVEDLRVGPAPEVGPRVVRITGRGKIDGLLGGEEAVRLQLVAGAGFEPATFGL